MLGKRTPNMCTVYKLNYDESESDSSLLLLRSQNEIQTPQKYWLRLLKLNPDGLPHWIQVYAIDTFIVWQEGVQAILCGITRVLKWI